MPLRSSLSESLSSDTTAFERYRYRASLLGGDADDFVYVGTVEGSELFTPEKLNAIRSAALELRSIPDVERVIAFTDVTRLTTQGRRSSSEVVARTLARSEINRGIVPKLSNRYRARPVWPKGVQQQRDVDLDRVRARSAQPGRYRRIADFG